jgi:ABC-type branched-subunit amino acid transport system ATPase component
LTLLDIEQVTKHYGALRPLRITELHVAPGERVALVGFDRPSAEVFISLATGQSLPDSGRVAAFGRPTDGIRDSHEWLGLIDQFGIVSERAVLLESLTVLQNLAMPFTLSIDPIPADVLARAEALAGEVGLPDAVRADAVSSLDAAAKARVRLGRALALGPSLLLLDHASAALTSTDAAQLAADTAAVVSARGIAAAALTADEAFARAFATRVLRWEPATGRLTPRRGWFGGSVG